MGGIERSRRRRNHNQGILDEKNLFSIKEKRGYFIINSFAIYFLIY